MSLVETKIGRYNRRIRTISLLVLARYNLRESNSMRGTTNAPTSLLLRNVANCGVMNDEILWRTLLTGGFLVTIQG